MYIINKGVKMKTEYCPHCGTKHFIEELNFILLQNINGYKIDSNSIIVEQSAKKIKSNHTCKCVSCGYHMNQEKKYL